MSSATQFVTTGGKVVAQSYHPCHLFGQGDLYGVGVRWSFYIQYAAAIVALWYKFDEDIRQLRFGLTVLGIALFINLCINSTGDDIVIMDWQMVLNLIGFLPVYSIWPYLYHESMRFKRKKEKWDLERKISEADATHLQMNQRMQSLNEDYMQVRRYLLELAIVQSNDPYYAYAGENYRIAVNNFIQSASLGDIIIFAGYQSRLAASRNVLETLQGIYQARIDEILSQYNDWSADQRRQIAEDTETLQRHEAELLALRAKEMANKELKKEQKPIWQREKLTLGIVMATWVAYLSATPWLYFKATARGRKEGCDVKLRTFPIFAPISVYNAAYLVWLRVSACCAIIFCVFSLAFAGWLVYDGIRDRPREIRKEAFRAIIPKTAPVGNGPMTLKVDTPSDAEIKQAGQEALEERILFQNIVYRIFGVPSTLFFSVSTIILVQLTLTSNNIDLSGSPATSSSQILPLIIAVLTATYVLFHVIVYHTTRENLEIATNAKFLERLGERLRRLTQVAEKKEEGKGATGPEDETEGQERGKQRTPEVRAEEGEAGVANPPR